MTASVDPIHAVAELPRSGDKVDLMVTLNGTETLLLQNVSIIAVGQSTTPDRSHFGPDGDDHPGQLERPLHLLRHTDRCRTDRVGRAERAGSVHDPGPAQQSVDVDSSVTQGNIASAL